jgi:trans-aconitate methyltransferase
MNTQTWDAALYDRHHGFVASYGQDLLELLAALPGERVLDLGCGTGDHVALLRSRRVVADGVDASPEMIARAIDKYPDFPYFAVADARELGVSDGVVASEAGYDAVFSNAVLHWIPEPAKVAASVAAALKPGGRFVAEFGGAGCVQTVRLALIDAANRRGLDGAALDPWFFPTEAAYRSLLEAQGFVVRAITLFPRPTPLPGDITDWLETFAQPFLGAVPPDDRRAFIQDVRDAVQPALFDPARGWSADYIRLQFDAQKSH